MAESRKSSKKNPGKRTKELPGLPLEQFEEALDAIGELVDRGDFQVFVGRFRNVRIIGDISTFCDVFARRLDAGKIAPSDAKTILREVSNFVQLGLAIPDVEKAVEFLEMHIFDDEVKEMGDEKEQFRHVLKEKLARVTDQTKALRRRLDRLGTTVNPTLEDVDVELINERVDRLRDETLTQPFLRLRLRYSSPPESYPWASFGFPWAELAPPVPAKSFELECDETDLDLLIRRLIEAKNFLLQSVVSNSSPKK